MLSSDSFWKGVMAILVAIGCDHAGLELKKSILEHFSDNGIEWKDYGTFSKESVDYPDIAYDVARGVAAGEHEFGVLVCGTGIGMSIAANKVKGIRAAVCSEPVSARLTRQHNDANIICLGARMIGEGMAMEILHAYMEASFLGGRHIQRLAKLN